MKGLALCKKNMARWGKVVGSCFHDSCTTRSEEEKCEIEDEDIGTWTCWDQTCFALIDVYYSIVFNGCLHISIDAYVFL